MVGAFVATEVGTFVDGPPSRGVGEATSVRAGVAEGVPGPAVTVGVSSGLTGSRGISAIR